MLIDYLIVTGLAAIPISEARGAILYGLGMGLNPIAVFLISFLINVATVPIIFWFLQQANFLAFAKRLFGERAMNAIEKNKFEKWAEFGLFVFVGIPLPMTGAWMGAFIATLLNMNKRRAFLAITAGVFAATVITFLGVSSGLFVLKNL